MKINGVKWNPPLPSKARANRFILHFLNLKKSFAIHAIELMLMFDCYQFFWDSNKRTSWLVSNYYLLQHGAGIIDISPKYKPKWNSLLFHFYNSGNFKKTYKLDIPTLPNY